MLLDGDLVFQPRSVHKFRPNGIIPIFYKLLEDGKYFPLHIYCRVLNKGKDQIGEQSDSN